MAETPLEDGGGRDASSGVSRPACYLDRHFQLPAAKIGPGEVYATQRDMLIVTVLGSCVSACLRDGARRYRLEADRYSLPLRTVPRLAEDQVSGLRPAGRRVTCNWQLPSHVGVYRH